MGQLLSGVDVRVLGLLEVPLQHLELLGREGGPGPPLLPFQGQARFGLAIGVVGDVATCDERKTGSKKVLESIDVGLVGLYV